jgi:tetratricopeptide (TPR) repeat protein
LGNFGSKEYKNNFIINVEDIVLKTSYKSLLFITLIGMVCSSIIFSKSFSNYYEKSDSLQLLTKYSLFSEYHKNKDFVSALPYGWEVLEMNPVKFRKWIYYKMEDALWYIHDSTDVTIEQQQSIEDTTMYMYNLALEHYPEDKAYFQSHVAFISEIWLDVPDDQIMLEYEKAVEYDKNLSSYYYDRLGELYIRNISDENDYKTKALDIYDFLSLQEPDNPLWPQKQEGLVENIEELVLLTKKNWLNDKENLEKAWKHASSAIRAEMYDYAIEALEFLVSKSSETVNYWNQLATAYQKTDKLNKAENALLKLIELDPDTKDHYLNLGIVYSDQGRFSRARTNYLKASEIGGGWALPIFYEGHLYEKAASKCPTDFDRKIVFQVAVDTYKKARRMDSTLQLASNRINALSASVPTQEDYFFRGYKSGDIIPVADGCPGWIGKSIIVP